MMIQTPTRTRCRDQSLLCLSALFIVLFGRLFELVLHLVHDDTSDNVDEDERANDDKHYAEHSGLHAHSIAVQLLPAVDPAVLSEQHELCEERAPYATKQVRDGCVFVFGKRKKECNRINIMGPISDC